MVKKLILLLLVVISVSLRYDGTSLAMAMTTTVSKSGTSSSSTAASILSNKKVVVVGGGPVGLYFAALLLQSDPSVKIEILEKETKSSSSKNAFGLGVGPRMKHRLQDVPGLYEKAISVSSTVGGGLNIPLVSRFDLVENMRNFLLEHYNDSCCRVTLGEGCASANFDTKTITTDKGREIQYDLLLGADGVNSQIRRFLTTDNNNNMGEQHYTENVYWKALQLPKQTTIEKESFLPIQHPSITGGRVLPKAPEGHFVLLYWKGEQHDRDNNPIGIQTVDDWKRILKEGMQEKKKKKASFVRKFIGLDKGKDSSTDKEFVYDEELLQDFVESRSKHSHHLQLERYDYPEGSVALIGDSAHSFNSALGQGCATALECTHMLVEKCLLLPSEDTTLEDALSKYTELATKESHAMTDISLVTYGIKGGFNLMTFKAMPLVLFNMLRGKSLIKRMMDITVPYSTIAKENRRLLKICRRQFEKERKPFVPKD